MIRSRSVVRRARKSGFWIRHRAQLHKPRLCVFRSSKHISVQLIDDLSQSVVVSASSCERGFDRSLTGVRQAKEVGILLANRAVEKGLSELVFDRNGFSYHGRVKALADSVRGGGLKF